MSAPSFHPSWTPETKEILARSIERHGGWTAWERFSSVRIKPLYLTGMIPAIKGHPRTFPLPGYFEVFPKEQRVVFQDYPAAGRSATYAAGSTELGGQKRAYARDKYKGLVKNLPWQPEDALYFFGYAWSCYISYPFLFPESRFLRHRQHNESGENWEAITLELPWRDAHCRVQTFYFDASGLLRRHDYIAEIVGRWAMGAHYTENYQKSSGIEIALERRVYPRLGSVCLGYPSALAASLELV